MSSATDDFAVRAEQIDRVSNELLPYVALLTRLLARQMSAALTRSEAGLLNTLSSGPRRITDLAELEGLAQPTTTLLVKRLEERGLVTRERPANDGRVVLVQLSQAGRAALDATTEMLAALVAALQRAGAA